MSGVLAIVLPVAILIGGAFIIYVLARLFNLNNRVEAILTVVVLAIALMALVNNYHQIEELATNPDACFWRF